MKKFFGLGVKTYIYLIDYDIEDKKTKDTKMYVIKRKLKFQDYKNCLEANELENKINYLEKNKIDVDSLKKDHKEFLKNKRLISKTQHRFKSERHNVFTEEINKITLSSNDDTRMQPIHSIETYACGTSKDLVRKKEEIKCNDIITQCKK